MTATAASTSGLADSLPARVHIAGAGLIGASLGLALTRAGIDVTLTDINPAHVDHAVSVGAGREITDSDGDPAIVVAAVPPSEVAGTLAHAGKRWPDATLTDVASVKSAPLREAIEAGIPSAKFIGGHPMAGREVSGPTAAHVDLFDDRVWVLCPTQDCVEYRLAQLMAMVTACGALPVVMSPEEHDRAVAVTSHLPQVVASSLAGGLLHTSDEALRVSGQGLRDMTRIADSDPQLWRSILAMNGTEVAAVLEFLIADLSAVQVDLAQGQGGMATMEMLQRGVQGRARIPGKHGLRAKDYATVTVLVKDEPGELARLFVAAGTLRVNLEDVRIEHILGRPSGLIDLFVQPAFADTLAAGLREQAFDVRG